MDPLNVLALNSGSSSLKFGCFLFSGEELELVLSGQAEALGESSSHFEAKDASGAQVVSENGPMPGQKDAVERIGRLLDERGLPAPHGVGHRIVHGGPKLLRHCVIDATVEATLAHASAFAPLHTPAALAVVRFAREHFPQATQVACFDTAFHADLPQRARVLPIPRRLESEGLRRYGFHGLSCESIVRKLGEDCPARLIVAHLGNGASLTAIRDRQSIDTSMGLTPTGGIMMGTRSGELDPGILVYLAREKGYSADALEALVDHQSGLLGVSGISSDMRDLHAAAATQPNARLALDMFAYSVRKEIAAMMSALEGLDLLVFTGGIGENDAAMRLAICAGLGWCGLVLDPERNAHARSPLSAATSTSSIRMIPSGEDEQIAWHCRTLIDAHRH